VKKIGIVTFVEYMLNCLMDDRRLRAFEKRVLRRLFGPKRDEMTGEWRKLYNEELNDLYCLMICTAHPVFFR